MHRIVRATALTAALLVSGSALAQDRASISWTASGAAGKEPHFTLQAKSGSGTMLRSGPMNEVPEIQPAWFAGDAASDVRFTIRRDAATLACSGVAGHGSGSGTCILQPDPGYAAGLRRRGLGPPDEYQTLRLALSDVRLAYIDSMREVRIGADIDSFIRLRNHDIEPGYVRDLRRAGVPGLDAGSVIRLSNHEVSPAYVTSVKAAGASDIDAEGLVRLRNHDVDAGFIRKARAAGFTDLSAEQLVWYRNHGLERDSD